MSGQTPCHNAAPNKENALPFVTLCLGVSVLTDQMPHSAGGFDALTNRPCHPPNRLRIGFAW
ncbi:MAG: hypothetical protein KDE24_22250, partial [Caldilinea sp.]|nr:hypothetical protein [Caldilinea sp.]